MKSPLIALALLLTLSGAFAPAADQPATPAPKPAEPVTDDPPKVLEMAHMKELTAALKAAPGVTRNNKVHILTLPRTDLDVNNLEMGEIPVEAGLESTLRLFRCHCGKYFIVGEFCVLEYESNDVIDALRAGQFQIASVGPMLVQEKPRILLVRFQGEGKIEDVIKTLKGAVQWIGENRTSHNPVK